MLKFPSGFRLQATCDQIPPSIVKNIKKIYREINYQYQVFRVGI